MQKNKKAMEQSSMNLFIFATIAFVIILLCLTKGLEGREIKTMLSFMNNEKKVGKDIKIGDVTEFYYTYSTSTFPPDYQRYHFYTKNGKYFFYHEKREGKHWPLMESDKTVFGTVELSEKEWAMFFDYLKGGVVEKRKEHLESGNSGPWLYLYWKGDRSQYQEFSFESFAKKTSFEEFCIKLKQSSSNN